MRFLMVFLLLIYVHKSNAQRENHINQNFCNTLMFIVGHVDNDFRLLKGEKRDPKSKELRFVSKGKVMGTSRGDIVHDSAWRYEGVLFEERSREKFEKYYDKYAGTLEECLRNNHDYKHLSKYKEGKKNYYADVVFTYKEGGIVTIRIKGMESGGVHKLLVVVSKK